MALTEAVWVYALGIPLYIAVLKLRERGVKVFTSPVHVRAAAANSSAAGSVHESKPDEDINKNN